jgi:F420-dependent oxidoreductase-like protein
MDLAIMIEGQNGLTWPRWKAIVWLAEELGFAGVYRSDHYTNASPPDIESLELWTSLTWLAANTEKLEFGPLVSPVSFREPTMTARIAASVDDLSGGRLQLGIGAGWQEREHHHFGFDLLDLKGRFRRFEEGLQVISGLLTSDDPLDFSGKYYHLHEAILLPRPARPGGPPILIGGNGEKRTLPLAAKYASCWNAVYLSPAEFARRCGLLDKYLAEAGRKPGDVHRSMMTGVWFGNEATIDKRVADHPRFKTVDEVRERGVLVGDGPQIIEGLKALEAAGCQRVMLQWLELDDLDGLQALGEAALPHFRA